MRKILLLVLLACSTTLFSQNYPIPCAFSWENAPTSNGNRNYVTPARSQPYQGPCLSFAFTAAIETMYAIENNNSNPTMKLAEAYLDYKAWGASDFVPDLNSSFKIPLRSTVGNINSFAPEECPVNNPEQGCSIPRSHVLNYIEHPNGQRSYRIYFDEPSDPEEGMPLEPEWFVEDGGSLGNYVTVNSAREITINTDNISSNEDIKEIILNEGPIVVKVNNNNYQLFRSYINPENLSFHAYTLIGWTADGKWRIKDSWPGQPSITNSKSGINLYQLMQQGKIELFQVSGIGYNSYSYGQNNLNLITTECEPDPDPVIPELSSISVELDYMYLGGYNYSKFWVNVTNGVSVDNWVWGIAYPNGALKRSQINQPYYSSVLLSPYSSGLVTVYVRAYKNGITYTKERTIYLFNGNSGGGGGGFTGPE